MTKDADDEQQDEHLDKVDTVPPPPGEDDAYSAPTRMHSTPPEDLLQAMKEATRRGLPLKPQTLPQPRSGSSSDLDPKSGPQPRGDGSTRSTRPPPAASGPPPKLNDDVKSDEVSAMTDAEASVKVAAAGASAGSKRVELSLSALVAIGASFLVLLVIVTFLLLR